MTSVAGDDIFVEYFQRRGLSHFFYVPVLMPGMIKKMQDSGMTPVVAHSEKGAVYMADGYARISQKPGLCGCQHIGGSNLAAALREPQMAKIPVIALSGGPSLETAYRGLYQDIDDMPLFKAHSKWQARIDRPERIVDIVDQAYIRAVNGTPGPVHLQLSGFWGAVGADKTEAREMPIDPRYSSFPSIRPVPHDNDLERAARLINASKRPVIVAGTGAVISGAGEAISALAAKTGMGIATATGAKSLLVDDHERLLGVCGEYSRDCANIAISEADLVVFVGSGTGGMVTRNWSVPSRDTQVIQIDLDPHHIGRSYPGALPLVGDARDTVEKLTQFVDDQSRSEWRGRQSALRADWDAFAKPLETSSAIPMRVERLCSELSDAFPNDGILVVDTGHAPGWISRHFEVRTEGQTVIRAAGSLGYGYPASIGAKAAAPDRPVVCFTGDGGFLYHLTELETAVRYNLPSVVVVNNNSSLNQEKFLWDDNDGYAPNWKFNDVDYAAVAKAFGCWGARVEDPNDFGEAMREALACGKPAVLDVRTDENVVVPPSWGPGSGEPYRDA